MACMRRRIQSIDRVIAARITKIDLKSRFFSSLLELREDVLHDYYKDIVTVSPKFRAESAPPIERGDQRIAAGLARLKQGYRVEIRIQREGGAAEEFADELKEEHGNNINIEVLETLEIPARTTIRSNARKPLRMRSVRPLQIGTSVGHVDGGAGTLGAFVEYKGGDAVLSNAHVLAPPGAQRRDPIFQPGQEGSLVASEDQIGELANRIHFRRLGANRVDAAICLLDQTIEHLRNTVPAWCETRNRRKKIAGTTSALDLRRGTKLAKIGRTTGYTEGVLSAAAMNDITVFYHGAGNFRFDNVIEITWTDLKHPFTRPGDSGSLVFDPATKKAVGLHFAGGQIRRNGKIVGVSYACDIASVLDGLKCRLIL
jgi:hypothetical protein